MSEPWVESPELGAIPGFSNPLRPLDPPIPESTTESLDSSSPTEPETTSRRSGLLSKLTGRNTDGGPPTTTTATKPKVAPGDVQAVTIGLIGLAFIGAAYLYRQRTRTQLRMPTSTEQAAIGTPVARIINRHASLAIFTPDVADMIEAGSAIGAYLSRGPLSDGPVGVQQAEQVDPDPLYDPAGYAVDLDKANEGY